MKKAQESEWPSSMTVRTDGEGLLLVPAMPSRDSSDKWNKFLWSAGTALQRLDFRGNEEPWFRGSADAQLGLTPSLFRQELTKQQSWCVEYDTYFEFRMRAQEVHVAGVDGWDVLFFMQHHGVPTRLLDWTDTLMIAVFMALDSNSESDVWIHILNPYALNQRHVNERDIVAPEFILDWYRPPADDYEDLISRDGDWGFKVVALYPSQKSARQRAQRGFFTFHGDVTTTLDRLTPISCLCTLTLPKAAHAAARYALWQSGIDAYSAYPELHTLGRTIAEKYQLGKQFAVQRRLERQRKRRKSPKSAQR